MKKSAMYVVVFILLLIAVVIFCIVRMTPGEEQTPPSAEPSQTVQINTPEPVSTPAPVEESPEITAQPSAEPVPTAQPTPEPIQTPEPTPVETPLGQGSFSSETGTGLELVVSWTAMSAGADTARLDIVISASSYSFFTSELPGSISLTVDGVSYSLGSSAVEYDGNDMILSKLAEKSVSIALDSTGRANPGITVMWNYRGSYGGTELENLLAIGSADIG